jgi:hypothetical protein
MKLVYDIYAADDPLGDRLCRLTNQEYLAGTTHRRELTGTGSGMLSINSYQDLATEENFARGNYVIVRDLDLGCDPVDGLAVNGWWMEEGDFMAVSRKERGGRILNFKGPGTLAYLARAVMMPDSRSPSEASWDDVTIAEQGYWEWKSDSYGGIANRIIYEQAYWDPPAIPLVEAYTAPDTSVLDDHAMWSDDLDSAGASWPYFTGHYQIAVGTNLLVAIQDLLKHGIEMVMNPETFRIYAYIAGTYGVDRTSGSFAADKVRFEHGVNIAADLLREIHARRSLTHLLVVGSDGVTTEEVTAAGYSDGDPVRRGSIQDTASDDPGGLIEFGERVLTQLQAEVDTPTFPHPPRGQNPEPLVGFYSPGPIFTTPFVPPTRIYTWELNGTLFDNETGLVSIGLHLEGDTGKWWWGDQNGFNDASHHQSGSFAVTPGVSYTFELDIRWYNDPTVRNVDIHWIGDGTTRLITGAGHSTGVNYHESVTVTAPAGATGAFISFSAFAGMAADNIWWSSAAEGGEPEGTTECGGDYWIGDLVRLHTGTDEHDYNEADFRAAAINWLLRAAGDWDVQPELGAQFAIDAPELSAGGSTLAPATGVVGPPRAPTFHRHAYLSRSRINNSGITLTPRDIVIPDPADDTGVVTSTDAAQTAAPVWVVIVGGEDGESVVIALDGGAFGIHVNDPASIGDYLYTSTTAGQADASPTRAAGAFAYVVGVDGGGNPTEVDLWAWPDGSSGGGAGHVITEDGGSGFTARANLDFRHGLDVTDDSGSNSTRVAVDESELDQALLGGTSPDIPKSILDAKGDLISATADNTPAKVTVGADDTILMADSAAPAGLKWVASASPSAVGTAAATGTADTFTRGDHVHAHETGHVVHDTIWDAAGDLALGTGADTAAKLAIGATAQGLTVRGGTAAWEDKYGGAAIIFDGGGSVITTGNHGGDIRMPYDATLVSWTLEADVSGSIVVDIWKHSYVLDTPPVVGDTIIGGGGTKPTLASHQSNTDTTLTGYNVTFTAGDVLRFNVDSATTVKRVTLNLRWKKA